VRSWGSRRASAPSSPCVCPAGAAPPSSPPPSAPAPPTGSTRGRPRRPRRSGAPREAQGARSTVSGNGACPEGYVLERQGLGTQQEEGVGVGQVGGFVREIAPAASHRVLQLWRRLCKPFASLLQVRWYTLGTRLRGCGYGLRNPLPPCRAPSLSPRPPMPYCTVPYRTAPLLHRSVPHYAALCCAGRSCCGLLQRRRPHHPGPPPPSSPTLSPRASPRPLRRPAAAHFLRPGGGPHPAAAAAAAAAHFLRLDSSSAEAGGSSGACPCARAWCLQPRCGRWHCGGDGCSQAGWVARAAGAAGAGEWEQEKWGPSGPCVLQPCARGLAVVSLRVERYDSSHNLNSTHLLQHWARSCAAFTYPVSRGSVLLRVEAHPPAFCLVVKVSSHRENCRQGAHPPPSLLSALLHSGSLPLGSPLLGSFTLAPLFWVPSRAVQGSGSTTGLTLLWRRIPTSLLLPQEQ